MNEINSIFNTLASNGIKYKEGQSVQPSQLLRKTIEPEYQIGSIKYQLASTCARIDTSSIRDKMPQLRNPIRNVTFELGSIFYYQIPSDTFISSKQTDTRDLSLELVSPSGYIVDTRRDCIGFIPENQTIYGLALNEKLIDENLDYRLIARDPDSNLNAYDVFVLQVLPDRYRNLYTHEITMQFKPKVNVDMDLYSKVTIASKFASSVFESDLNNFKILKIKRHRYEPQYKSNYDYHRKKRSTQSILSRTFYEYSLTAKSFASINSNCPAEQIQRQVITRIFNVSNMEPEARLAMLKKIFLPDYELVYLGFRSIGKCKNQISPTYIGTKLIADRSQGHDELLTPTDQNLPPTGPVQPSTTETTRTDDILLRTIVPALLIIMIILLISCVLIVILVRRRNLNYKKNRFDINPNMHGVGEAESFLQKGRNPVILETDLNPMIHQQVYNPVGLFSKKNFQWTLEILRVCTKVY